MAKSKLTNFRFSPTDLKRLQDLAEVRGLTRAQLVRTLVAEDMERRGLAASAAEAFIERLRNEYDDDEVPVEFVIVGGNVDTLRINGKEVPIADPVNSPGQSGLLEALLIHHAPGRAYLHLDDPDSGACLRLADLHLTAGAEVTYRLNIGALTPSMHEPDAEAPNPVGTRAG